MKTDDQVLAAATETVDKQWCSGGWHDPDQDAYCAIGAIEKAMGCTDFDDVYDLHHDGEITRAQVEQVERIARRLTAVVEEQYPGLQEKLCAKYGWKLSFARSPVAVVECFNDTHTREEMLAIFEKAQAHEE